MERLSNSPGHHGTWSFSLEEYELPDTSAPVPSPQAPVHCTEAALRRRSWGKGKEGASPPGLGQGSA